jgi:hypothetical protein
MRTKVYTKTIHATKNTDTFFFTCPAWQQALVVVAVVVRFDKA